ncbi:MAG: phytanoyl-CoA dioxygenase family protein [Pseudomonadota bacterium]
MEPARRYGVKEQTSHSDEIDAHVERLELNGCTWFDAGLDEAARSDIEAAFDRAFAAQADSHGGLDALRNIDEHNTIRAPLLYDRAFLNLAQNPAVLGLAARIFRGAHETGGFILNQQNGISNPPGGPYNQGAWHRDLPYQHFTTSRPLAINALYCIEPFTLENGATLVAPGTHRRESFPSDALLDEIATPVCVPAGSFLVLDCMVFHSGGVNRSDTGRRAVNHVYTLPFIRQQIDLPAALDEGGRLDHAALDDAARRLLGFGNDAVRGPGDYYARRQARLNS